MAVEHFNLHIWNQRGRNHGKRCPDRDFSIFRHFLDTPGGKGRGGGGGVGGVEKGCDLKPGRVSKRIKHVKHAGGVGRGSG